MQVAVSVPYFSVVVPIYNKRPHIERAIQSILKQTFQDFEIILIDDASTDGSQDEIFKFQDPRIRVLRRSVPGPGGYAARNLGIKEARAEWVAFLDADDEWSVDHLRRMFELQNLFPDCGFLACGWQDVFSQQQGVADGYYKSSQNLGLHRISFLEYVQNAIVNNRPVYTSVAVMQKKHAAEIFPAGQAKRGGDLHAFLLLLAKTPMAWSPHIGAFYYHDSVNMITKVAPASPTLPIKIIALLQNQINAKEMRYLKKYSNRRIWNAFLKCSTVGGESFSLRENLFWREDLGFALRCIFLSMIQKAIPLKIIIKLKKKFI